MGALNPFDQVRLTRGNTDERLVAFCFVGLLLMSLVGVSPFGFFGSGDPQFGNVQRQLIYTALFGLIFSFYLRSGRSRVFSCVPLSTVAVLLWMLMSVSWSIDPLLTLRRAVLVTMVTLSILMCVQILGSTTVMRLSRNVLASVILVDLVSVPLISSATHSYFGQTAWAGMHGHKNTAGAVATLSALFAWHFFISTRSLRDFLLFFASTVFLAGTLSKTALGILVLCVPSMLIYRLAERRRQGRFAFRVVFLASTFLFLSVAAFNAETILLIMEDPDLLTDRGSIWHVVVLYAQDHFWLGAGFGAFWDSSMSTVLYVTQVGSAASTVGHAHNAFFEIQAGLGFPGVVLTTFAFLVMPLYRVLRFRVAGSAGGFCFALMIFVAVGNITKSQFLDRDNPEWVFFLICLGLLLLPVRRDVAFR